LPDSLSRDEHREKSKDEATINEAYCLLPGRESHVGVTVRDNRLLPHRHFLGAIDQSGSVID
jgi:hypothetical protein